MRNVILLSALGALAMLPARAEARQDSRRSSELSRVDTTFAFNRDGIVSLSIGDGLISVTTWNQDRVRVRATSERGSVRIDATSMRLSLEVGRMRGGDTQYEVTVPSTARLIARAMQGDIRITGVRGGVEAGANSGDVFVNDVGGPVDITTVSGDIDARGVTGNLEIGTMNGDVTVRDVRGDVEIASISGDIDISNATARFVRARSTNGDLSFGGTIDAAGRYEFTSHGGNVYLVIPQNVGALLTVATYSGEIDSEFPITLRPGEHGTSRFTFEVGKGDARISAESFSGDVTIRSTASTRSPSDR